MSEDLKLVLKQLIDLRYKIGKVGIGLNINELGNKLEEISAQLGLILAQSMEPPVMRTVTQIAGDEHRLYALCSDNSIWEMNASGIWDKHPAIPIEVKSS